MSPVAEEPAISCYSWQAIRYINPYAVTQWCETCLAEANISED